MSTDIGGWSDRILQGDVQAISRAISAIENSTSDSIELLKRLFPQTGRAKIIGVTGATGSGKSSLVDAVIATLRKNGKTVGVLAVDPTSPFSGGAILGDRIRMQRHTSDPGTYIRSMATRGALGGLSRAAYDAALLLDAAGKDYILIETVGVGQDEFDIARLADVTLLLLVPGMGDDVQAAKAGIMEIADIFVVNKADLPGADRVEQEIEAMLSLAPSDERRPAIIRTVATAPQGVDDLLQAIADFLDYSDQNGLRKKRQLQHWRELLVERVRERLSQVLQQNMGKGLLDNYAASVVSRAEDPYSIAEHLVQSIRAATVRERPQDHDQLQSSISGASGNLDRFALDHLGIAVKSLDRAVNFYEESLGLDCKNRETIPQEKTNVAMLPLGDTRIELLEPTEPDSPVGRFLAKRGEGLHHICIRVRDLRATILRLQQNGVKLIHSQPAVGAGGHEYVFIHPSSAGGVLLELVQAK